MKTFGTKDRYPHIFISHRGNLTRKFPERENSPDYIVEAFEAGYDVEVDVRAVRDKDNRWQLWLGHNSPQYEFDIKWWGDQLNQSERELMSAKRITPGRFAGRTMYIHAKSIETVPVLYEKNPNTGGLEVFLHQDDSAILLSHGLIWTNPGELLTFQSICVLPEIFPAWDWTVAAGVCSDEIQKYKAMVAL